jgi:hypothetical protein
VDKLDVIFAKKYCICKVKHDNIRLETLKINKLKEKYNKMTTKLYGLRQKSYAVVALLVVAATSFSALAPQFAHAAGQATVRSIQLSDSGSSANGSIPSGVGSGTAVTYNVKFTVTSTTAIGGIVVDICDSSPLIGDVSCTYPAGFSWGAATLTAGYTGIGTGWTAAGIAGGGGTNKQVLELSNATPQATAVGTPVNFNITGVTNPSVTNHPYWARIVTFDTTANMTAQYTTSTTVRAATFANKVDYGGIALSTSTPISITARVMETMAFCTSLAAPTQNCGGLSSPVLTLGHGANLVLDASAIDTGTVWSQVTTNATNGYVIRIHSSNACGGLSKDGGTTCPIPAINSGAAVFSTMTAGTAAFGMQATSGSPVGTGSGTNTVSAPYNGATTSYGFDTVSSPDSAITTYGSKVLDSTGAVANSVNNSYIFGATASAVTPAGIYTANESLIATGTF